MVMSLPTALEIAANAPEREPTDEELLSNFTSGIPHPTDPRAQVSFGAETLRYEDAIVKERSQYVAAKRRALAQARQHREALSRDVQYRHLFPFAIRALRRA